MKFEFPSQEEISSLQPYIKRRKKKKTAQLKTAALQWTRTAWENKMDYEVNWLGIPIIQNPYDMIIMQELIFALKPDYIIETGIAHGGSLIYYASILEMLGRGKVIGIDIDIRKHNRRLLEKHPLIKRVTMIEQSSIDPETVSRIKKIVGSDKKILVILDSDHTKPHVYAELQAYKDIVTKGSYMVVFDTFMPYLVGLEGETSHFKNDSAMDAVKKFLKENDNFVADRSWEKFYITSSPNGFLKRIK